MARDNLDENTSITLIVALHFQRRLKREVHLRGPAREVRPQSAQFRDASKTVR